MQRIDDPSNISAAASVLTTVSPGYFRRPSVLAGDQGTIVTADWCNDIQENIVQTVLAGGGTLAKGVGTNLRDAVAALIDADVAVLNQTHASDLGTIFTDYTARDATHAALVSSEGTAAHLEVATAAEAVALSSNTRALTPHNLTDTFEAGSNANGNYLFLPTGPASGERYIAQWGRSASGGENRTITLPQTMDNADYYANWAPETQSNNQGVNTQTTTDLICTSSGYTGAVRWFVFGLGA